VNEIVLLRPALSRMPACVLSAVAEFSLSAVERGEPPRPADAGERGAAGSLGAVRKPTPAAVPGATGADPGHVTVEAVLGELAGPAATV
jgi:hypothetical protein